MGFGAPAPEKLTQKTNAKKRIPNQHKISAKSGAQKLNKNQGADIKCVKKKTSCRNRNSAEVFFAAKVYRSASSTAFLRFLSIQSEAMSEIASDFDFSLTDFMILLFKECSVFAG